MKKLSLAIIFVMMMVVSVAYAERKIGDITLKGGWTGEMKIELLEITDHQNPFVTLYLTHVVDTRIGSTADPSNNCIAARLTGEIPVKNGKRMINKSVNSDIFSKSKSWISKTLKIIRHYDPKKDVLIYTVFSRKGWRDGSPKHSMSVVPLSSGM